MIPGICQTNRRLAKAIESEQCVHFSWMKVKGCQLSNPIVVQFSLILFSMLKMYTDRISMELSVPIIQFIWDLLVKFNWQENISATIHYGRDSSLNARPTMYALN